MSEARDIRIKLNQSPLVSDL